MGAPKWWPGFHVGSLLWCEWYSVISMAHDIGCIFHSSQEECEAKEEQCEGEEDIYSLSTTSATQQGLQNPLLSHLTVFHWLGCIITICSSFLATLPASRCTNNLCKICSQSFFCCTLSYLGANQPIVCILCARLTCNWKVESTFWVLNLRQQKNGRPRRKSRLRRQLKTSANEKLHLFHLR